jgi:sporulation-control protein spo0M
MELLSIVLHNLGIGLDKLETLAYSRACAEAKVKSAFHTKDGRIAQVVEQLTLNQRVVGSSPTAPTILQC